jgi:hypothetical protein
VSAAGCSCRRLQRHHFDLISFIWRLLGAANQGFSVPIRLNSEWSTIRSRNVDWLPGTLVMTSLQTQETRQTARDAKVDHGLS